MHKQNIKGKVQIASYDDLLSGGVDHSKSDIADMPLINLYEFKNHPFHVVDDERMDELVQSIKEKGVLSPAIVRKREKGGYEIISGHRRKGILRDIKGLFRGFLKPDGKPDLRKILIQIVPYVLMAYVVNKVSYGYRISPGEEFWGKVMNLFNDFGKCFRWPLPSLYPYDFLIGIAGGVGFKLLVIYRQKNAKKFRKGEEYGSARWGTEKDIAPFMDPVFEKNILLTETERLMLNGRPSNPEYARNKNVLVIGGSGSGKTRFFVKPNLMQMHSSYVITDPKGTILPECGKMLLSGIPRIDADGKVVKDSKGSVVKDPYKIKVFNTINFDKSMHYNPFAYIKNEEDILNFVNTLMVNTKGEGAQAGEDFWQKAEQLLYVALISYIFSEAPAEEQNFAMLLDMIDASETREEDESFKNAVDLLFEELEEDNPNSFALKQYKKYKLAAGKTAKSILISCAARLSTLKTFSKFDWEDLAPTLDEDEYADFKSWYLYYYEKHKKGEKESILVDVDFTIELVRTDKINVVYILNLLKEINRNDKEELKKSIDLILREIERSDNEKMRYKREIMKAFVTEKFFNLDPDDDIIEAYNEYEKEVLRADIEAFSAENDLSVEFVSTILHKFFADPKAVTKEYLRIELTNQGIKGLSGCIPLFMECDA